MGITRRHALRTTGAAAAAVALAPFAKVRGANDDVRVAVIGVGGKGGQHVRNFGAVPGVRVVTVCDADRARAESIAGNVDPRPAIETDLRRVLDDDGVDAVVVATPNHWHALATVWACRAGKDVYVEKPASHNVWEGQQMIAAARRHQRIVQVGTQRRSDPGWQGVMRTIHAGELGPVQRVRCLYYGLRGSIGKLDKPAAPPKSVDYDLWAGPAPMAPIMRPKFHYDWHWMWETGNGELGNNGPHLLDLARWAIKADALPDAVVSVGGRFAWDDVGQTPNTHVVYHDYRPAPIITEIRNLPKGPEHRVADDMDGVRVGLIIECEGGTYRGLEGGGIYDAEGKLVRKITGNGGRDHPANFIAAVRSRKVGDLTCDIAEGHLSTALCEIGNISHRVGAARPVADARTFADGNAALDEAGERMAAHLEANGVDASSKTLTIGAALKLDPRTQRFIDGPQADAANALLRREYRAPFVLTADA